MAKKITYTESKVVVKKKGKPVEKEELVSLVKERLSEEEKVAHRPDYDPDVPLNKQRHLR